MPECFVAKASEMADGDRRIVLAGTAEIGVFCKDGAYFAYSNTCVHSGGPAVRLDAGQASRQVPHGEDLVNQAEPDASFDPLFQGLQHARCPDRWFHPCPP